MRIVNNDIQACSDCVQIIANGEISSHDDGGNAHAEKMLSHYGRNLFHVVYGGRELGFCSTPCEVCGTSDAGDRETVAELGPDASE